MAQDKPCAQAVREGRARRDTLRRPGYRLRPRPASADGGDSRRGPLRPGRFAARDRAGHRWLDVEVIERTDLAILGLWKAAEVPEIGWLGVAGAQLQFRTCP